FREGARFDGHSSGLHRQPRVPPGTKPSIQHRDPIVAEDPEGPPYATGTEVRAGTVVDYDVCTRVDAERFSDVAREVGGGWEHVRKVALGVASVIGRGPDCAGDVGLTILRVGIPVHGWQVPGGIQDAYSWIPQSLLQPVDRDHG